MSPLPAERKVLVIGYGNPGRLDDGLGPALADAIAARGLPGVTVESDYQLAVEDAEAAARHDVVVFADASVEGDEPFAVTPIEAAAESGMAFTTHSVSPEAIMAMTRDLFDASPRAFILAIRGYRFDGFGEGLSEEAKRNLDAAVSYLATMIIGGTPWPTPQN